MSDQEEARNRDRWEKPSATRVSTWVKRARTTRVSPSTRLLNARESVVCSECGERAGRESPGNHLKPSRQGNRLPVAADRDWF